MIEAEDLRIGNYVANLYEANAVVRSIVPSEKWGGGYLITTDKNKSALSTLLPILLTEDWLLRLGFEKIEHVNGYTFWSLKRKRSDLSPAICIYESYTRIGNNRSVKHVTCVHQLQNLYFALTGIELKLKQ